MHGPLKAIQAFDISDRMISGRGRARVSLTKTTAKTTTKTV
ncbi:hypothetical protein [Aquamicrobium sp. LC103]|nr:hypothetical protein [Aquamicrobium sp. LC103]